MLLLGRGLTRRALLRHCSLLALAAVGVRVSAAQKAAPRRLLLVVGDSLSAEYGLERGSGWVALLQQRLQREKMAIDVVNASISGDTTSGGRSRLPALLTQHRPAHRDHRAGRQRRAARPAAEHDAGQPVGDDPGRQGRGRARADRRHAGAAQLRAALRAGLRRPVRRRGQGAGRGPGAFLAEGRGRRPRCRSDVPGRPHPPECSRRSRACSTTSGRC